MKGGGKSCGLLGGGFIENHDLYFFVVGAHTTSLCPILAGSFFVLTQASFVLVWNPQASAPISFFSFWFEIHTASTPVCVALFY